MIYRVTNFLTSTKWVAVGIILLCWIQILVWAFDRTPPLRVDSYRVENIAEPGGYVRFRLKIEQDVDRKCEVIVSHFIQDSRGYRFYMDSEYLSSFDLERLAEVTPGEARIILPVPNLASSGAAFVEAALRYSCNPVHKIYPIYYRVVIPFEIKERQ